MTSVVDSDTVFARASKAAPGVGSGGGHSAVRSSLPGQHGRHFADDIFRCIFVNEKFGILIKISLKLVPKGPTDNNLALVKIMAWRRIGDKPVSEPMLTRLTNAYMRHSGEMNFKH